MSSGLLLVLMGGLFLLLGYMGVPVAFAIIAGVLAATAFTPISFQSMVGQLFHGIDSETLLAVPFFLLVGELIASASTMANLIPPSIMAVVYGATGNVSIGGLFLGGVVPGVLIGVGLMIYSYFFGPVGTMKKRARLVDIFVAARGSALPMVIPLIIMGGILTGWFTPTEAGMAAAAYILLVLIPVLNPRHVRRLPGDFMYTGLLYSL